MRCLRAFWPVGHALALPALVLVLGGCVKDGWPCCRLGSGLGSRLASRPQAPYPAPFGSHVRAFITAQGAKADGADFTIFLDEWYMGGARLGPFGQRHVLALVPVLGQVPTPLLIQCGYDPELDQQRRLFVVEQLTSHGVPDADKRVVLGFPEAEGLDAEFAERCYLQMLRGNIGRFGYRSSLFGNFNQGLGAFGTGGLFGAGSLGGTFGGGGLIGLPGAFAGY